MKDNIFSSLVSITKGLHRDKRLDREFQLLLADTKLNPLAANAIFKIDFKRPLNSKKEYYYNLIFNETEKTIVSFIADFPENAPTVENVYTYTILHNKFDKYLKDIASYIDKREITADLSNDDNYIIYYLKVSAIRLYAELQEQYGQFSDKSLFSIPDIAEKYFNDPKYNSDLIKRIEISKKEVPKKTSKLKSKSKTTFGYVKDDTDWLYKILKRLQLSIDLLDTKTDVKDLQNLLLANDFTDYQKKIYLDCKTTEFKYVLKQLQPHFKNLTPTLIEKTGLFYTKLGKPLTAQNIFSKSKAPLKKEIIDNIFKQIQ